MSVMDVGDNVKFGNLFEKILNETKNCLGTLKSILVPDFDKYTILYLVMNFNIPLVKPYPTRF